MKNFAFYVSGKATRIKKFLQKYKKQEIIKSVKFILIDNVDNTELRYICNNFNITYYEIDLRFDTNKNIYISNLFLKYLMKHKIDYAFIFANKILVGDILKIYKNKLINFHPSILPSHKGLNAIDQSLQNNTFLLGNSAHFVNEEVDGGRVIMQNIFPAIKFKSYDDVLDKQLIMLLQLMIWIEQDRLIVKENGDVYIYNAKYDVQDFIPNIEVQIEDYQI